MQPSQLFHHWNQIRSDLLSTIDKFNEEELSFTPFRGSWPAGRVMLHIADTEDFWIHHIVRHEIGDVTYQLADYPAKADIVGVLNRARNRTLPYLASLTESDLERSYTSPRGETFSLYWILWHVLEHEIHHRGELSLMLGQLGREGLDV